MEARGESMNGTADRDEASSASSRSRHISLTTWIMIGLVVGGGRGGTNSGPCLLVALRHRGGLTRSEGPPDSRLLREPVSGDVPVHELRHDVRAVRRGRGHGAHDGAAGTTGTGQPRLVDPL